MNLRGLTWGLNTFNILVRQVSKAPSLVTFSLGIGLIVDSKDKRLTNLKSVQKRIFLS